ncbi:MAG: N-acetyltransferase [Deltaproteobacteria bacterium]|jgi:amino-acid N-acetyltransferase|nr:N-acetyltransferase [Deltaproteobacteria bacterium]
MDKIRFRKARVGDVKGIQALLRDSAGQGQLLPRALTHLYKHVRDFYVAEPEDGRLAACCGLSIVWEDLAEVRSLVVEDSFRGQGLGRRIVLECLGEAGALGVRRAFALTYQADFFKKLGFVEVDKDVLPQKIWADCIHCPKYPDCDETAVLLDL